MIDSLVKVKEPMFLLRCRKHPSYTAFRKPRLRCTACKILWEASKHNPKAQR